VGTAMRNGLALAFFLAISFGAAGIGAMFTFPQLDGWYAGLVKPAWNPPAGVFGPVWNTLYALMAVAAWLVWRKAGPGQADGALAWFGALLMLNAAWSGLFFGLPRPDWAVLEIALLWLAVLATLIAFWAHHLGAALLLTPYLAWVTFAAILNLTIWHLN